jgi:hypothetical protein
MKRNPYLSAIVAGVALLALVHIVTAQGPGPQSATDVQAAAPGTGASTATSPALSAGLSTDFTYQGQLAKGGGPVNGACDFQFSLWDAAGSGSPPTGGTQIGSTQTVTNTNVTDGLFTVRLDFGDSAFTGDARHLQVAVRCPAGSDSYTTLAPRQPLTAAPYALGLRPGATISGTVPYPGAALVLSSSNSNTGTGDNGRIHSTAYGSSDLYLTSNDDVTIELDKNEDEAGTLRVDVSGLPVFQVDESGDAIQARSADGLVKAGVAALCQVVNSRIVQYFNNVNDEAIWIANGSGPGRCQINFGFDVSDRYIVATAAGDREARGVTVGDAIGHATSFFRWIAATGTGENGLIYVLVY